MSSCSLKEKDENIKASSKNPEVIEQRKPVEQYLLNNRHYLFTVFVKVVISMRKNIKSWNSDTLIL